MLPVLLPLPLGEGGGEGQQRWHSAQPLFRSHSAKNCSKALLPWPGYGLPAWHCCAKVGIQKCILLLKWELLAQAAPALEALFTKNAGLRQRHYWPGALLSTQSEATSNGLRPLCSMLQQRLFCKPFACCAIRKHRQALALAARRPICGPVPHGSASACF